MIIALIKLKYFIKKVLLQQKRYNEKFKYNVLKLNLGCGKDYKEGWINIDNNSDNNIKKLDINYDLSKEIPFETASVDYIFNEHFLEHLTVQEGQKFLKECKRVLKSKGVLRIAMPDLETTVSEYFNENWKEDNKEAFTKFHLNFIQTRAERINIAFRWWGHKWLYDKEELKRRLTEAGFEKIRFCELRKSEYQELSNLETRDQSTLIAEAIK